MSETDFPDGLSTDFQGKCPEHALQISGVSTTHFPEMGGKVEARFGSGISRSIQNRLLEVPVSNRLNSLQFSLTSRLLVIETIATNSLW